ASDLGRLDPEAIAQVRAEAWPLVRDAEELHDALHSMCLLREDEAPEWTPHLEELISKGRALRVDASQSVPSPHHIQQNGNGKHTAKIDSFSCPPPPPHFWTVAERWPLVKPLYPQAIAKPPVKLPDTVRQDWESAEAVVTLVRGRMQCSGPVTAERLGELL